MPSRYALTLGLFALLGSSGCGGGYLETPSCRYDPFDWFDVDLAYAVDQAGPDGKFDFNPADDMDTRRRGNYKFGNGDVSFSDDFKSTYWLTDYDFLGWGTVYTNGNLDLISLQTYTDFLGAQWAVHVRTERQRCEATITSTPVGLDYDMSQVPPDQNATQYIQSIVSDDKVVIDLVVPDGSYTYERYWTPEISQGSEYEYTNGGFFGYSKKGNNGPIKGGCTFYGGAWGDDRDFFCSTISHDLGSWNEVCEVYQAGTSVLSYDVNTLFQYDGSGIGTWHFYDNGATITCSFAQPANGRGTLTCDDGDSQSLRWEPLCNDSI